MINFTLLESINQLNNSTARPRLLYRKGAMAAGSFRPYMSFSDYTKADFLRSSDQQTHAVVRFSKASGEAGTADSLRDSRGFAVRFFTEEGKYDLIGQNFPVFYINEPQDFPDWIRFMLPQENGLSDRTAYWGFLKEHPEAIGITMGLFSDEGTIKSYRTMKGYGIGTYRWVNRTGDTHYVRYRWVPLRNGDEYEVDRAGVSDQEAEFLAGFEPDCASRDLYEAMEAGTFPVYELQVQIASEEQLSAWSADFLKATLKWPEERAPYTRVGCLELTEPLTESREEPFCFAPSNLVPGIEFGDREFLEVIDYIMKGDGRQRGGIT